MRVDRVMVHQRKKPVRIESSAETRQNLGQIKPFQLRSHCLTTA